MLAFIGTFLTFLIVSTLAYTILNLSLQQALIFGSLMAATDPVSVLSIFLRQWDLIKDYQSLWKGKALQMMGLQWCCLKIAIVTSALSFSGALDASLEFVKVVIGGLFLSVD
ncbi:hypothetical protein GCM10020331_094180 [Ectobacillus funiculus]